MSAMWLEFNRDFRDIIEPYKDYVRGLYMDTKKIRFIYALLEGSGVRGFPAWLSSSCCRRGTPHGPRAP